MSEKSEICDGNETVRTHVPASFSNGDQYEIHDEPFPVCTSKPLPEQCFRLSNKTIKQLKALKITITPERHTYPDGTVRYGSNVNQMDKFIYYHWDEYSTPEDAVAYIREHELWELHHSFCTQSPKLDSEVTMEILSVVDVPAPGDKPAPPERKFIPDTRPKYYVYCDYTCALYATCRRVDRIPELDSRD